LTLGAALAIAFIVIAAIVLAVVSGAAAPLRNRNCNRDGFAQRVCAAGNCEDLFRTDVYTGTEPYGRFRGVLCAESP
jgi:hypothetical protein